MEKRQLPEGEAMEEEITSTRVGDHPDGRPVRWTRESLVEALEGLPGARALRQELQDHPGGGGLFDVMCRALDLLEREAEA